MFWFQAFSDKSRDYTVPDPSVLAAQVPATAWQNPQAAPMYRASAPSFQTQVPGGQMPSWDPSLHAFRPRPGYVPGAFPVQTGAVPPVPGYAPAAQGSPIPMGITQPGVSPNVNLQPSGASTSVPGSSPGAQPNVRPSSASPPGQHYYG